VDSLQISAPLWGGDASRYASTCPPVQTDTVLKADDMLFQVHSLIDYFRGLPPTAPAAGMQFVFFVRHPLFNIRSLLAWASIDECAPALRKAEAEGSNNTLYLRIFTDQDGNLRPSANALARKWKAAAATYLRDPTRFAACVAAPPVGITLISGPLRCNES
jgi:hypothetical protein